MKEEDLSEYVRKDFEELGYTMYAEVQMRSGGPRCDMYGRIEDKAHPQYGRTIVIESKLSLNLKVLEQIYGWVGRANLSFILCPTTYKNIKTRRFVRELCKLLGIGILEVDINKNKYYITVNPKYHDNPKHPKLFEGQKALIASNADNNYATPFKNTVELINKHMANRDSDILMNVIKCVPHHYKSDISACKAIKYFIETNVIKNFYIRREKNKIVISKK